MNSPRCVWCGGKLEPAASQTDFCGRACQRAYEDWCAVRASARTQAVSRWRDMQNAKRGDMLNDLLSFGRQSASNPLPAAASGTRSER